MPATSARLSGSCYVPIESKLSRVEWRRPLHLPQASEVFAVHQVASHESNEFEEAVFSLRHLLKHVQQ